MRLLHTATSMSTHAPHHLPSLLLLTTLHCVRTCTSATSVCPIELCNSKGGGTEREWWWAGNKEG
eukprot:m.45619 g.45619  ORF g.45619 m.45619 type:complete len:65 (+) comp6674_c0_seq1:357-551(+)